MRSMMVSLMACTLLSAAAYAGDAEPSAPVADDAKPPLLKSYLDRWYWEVKGHIGGLTPQSTDDELRAAAPTIPVFELVR